MQGWVKIHREITNHEIWGDKPFAKGQAWLDLILFANYTDRTVLLGNSKETVCKGSLITSELKLMERWGWGRKKVRLFLNFLESEKMITLKRASKGTTITIVKYGVYQVCENDEGQQKNSKGTAQEQRRNSVGPAQEHKQERNKDNKERKEEDIIMASEDTVQQISSAEIKTILDSWNTLQSYGIRPVSRMTTSSRRYKMLSARIREYGVEDVLQAIENIKISDFLLGRKSDFMITFDWFILPNNFPKVFSGNYINRLGGGTGGNSGRATKTYDDRITDSEPLF